MFIIDSDNRLIAAEAKDLTRWGFSDIYQAGQALRNGTLRLDRDRTRLTLPQGEILDCHSESMDSMLGTWYLCTAEASRTEAESPSGHLETNAAEQPASLLSEEEPLSLLLLEEEEAPTEHAEPKQEEPLPERPSSSPEEELLTILPLEEEEAPTESEAPPSEEETEEESGNAEDELEALQAPSTEEEPDLSLMNPEEEKKANEESALEALLPLSEEEEIPEITRPAGTEEAPIFPLPETEATPWKELESEFAPDLHANAKRLELSDQEYRDLLREFIGDSRSMQKQLLDPDKQTRKNAAAVLRDAISLLHLAPLDRLIDRLESAPEEDRKEIVEAYERLLDRIETTTPSEGGAEVKREKPTRTEERVTEPGAEFSPLTETPEEPELPQMQESEPKEPLEAEHPEAELSITPAKEEVPPAVSKVGLEEFLKGVQPVPINFSLHLAAEELNLPEDLVLEFIGDFDKQGHEYLPVLIEAYESKDLDHLQKTAHMLKGAASNLRIEAMVDNLYDLQFDTEIERAPQRIRLFAGQLMSLDRYLKQQTNS